MAYLFVAYLILWTLLFCYMYSLAARQKRIEAELEALRGPAEGESPPMGGRGSVQ